MKRAASFALLLVMSGCATYPALDSPIHNVRYSAIGEQPFWMIVIGDDQIIFRQAGEVWQSWPRTLPRTLNGVSIWQSGDDTGSITLEASRGACSNSQGQAFEDRVVVRLNGNEVDLRDHTLHPFNQTLTGCGGQLVRGSQGQ